MPEAAFVTLETPRLKLRPFTNADFEAFAQMTGDPRVMQYLGDGRALSRTRAWFEMAAFIGHWHLLGFGEWAVEEKSTGAFVGRIGLQRPDGWPATEVGWMLCHEHWGKGYALEGARAALDYAFRQLKSERIISMIHPDNAGSIRVAVRLGETFERRMTVNGRDRLIYSISQT
ncbi:RimJ/RimL family protein N-acetyltransferase [Bradyrhizobium sp. USDA 4369]